MTMGDEVVGKREAEPAWHHSNRHALVPQVTLCHDAFTRHSSRGSLSQCPTVLTLLDVMASYRSQSCPSS